MHCSVKSSALKTLTLKSEPSLRHISQIKRVINFAFHNKTLRSTKNAVYTLSGRTGSALVWNTRGRMFEPRSMKQVLRFLGHVYTVQYMELRKYCQ